ncbi:MAG: DUF5666 domain-containing protein [Marinagarivorans sp.]
MLPTSFRSGLGLLVFCALLSCGGGGGGGGNAGIDGSGAPAIAVVSGPINGFGSVIVNGVHYNTEHAEFWVRGVRATEADLNVGSYIHLEGTTSADGKEGVAKLIYFQPNVIGAVSSVDLLAETFVVLGQTVHITNDTALDFAFLPRDINGIRVGQQVEVSGPLNAAGEVMATRVGLMQAAVKELAGSITDLDPEAKTFRINNITVNVSSTSNLPDLANGQKVIVRGANVVNGVLQPNSLELEQKPQLPQGQLITQTGLITRFVSVKDFTLANFDVTTTNATVYERCKPSDLRLNARATLVGHLQDGKLVADKISLLADVEWKIQGPISEIRNMSLEGGEILVQGSWLRLTTATRVDSELSMAGDRMKFANLRVNDYVVLTGHQEGTNQVVTSIEREDRPQLDIEKKILGFVQKSPLKADADAFQLDPQLTVLLEENTLFYDNLAPITKAQFVQKAAGKFVTVFGVMVDDGGFNTFKATSIQITPSPGGKGPKFFDKPAQPGPQAGPAPAPVAPHKTETAPLDASKAVEPVPPKAPVTTKAEPVDVPPQGPNFSRAAWGKPAEAKAPKAPTTADEKTPAAEGEQADGADDAKSAAEPVVKTEPSHSNGAITNEAISEPSNQAPNKEVPAASTPKTAAAPQAASRTLPFHRPL